MSSTHEPGPHGPGATTAEQGAVTTTATAERVATGTVAEPTAAAITTSAATTMYAHVGGQAGVRSLVAAWYPTVLADPLLQPLFGAGHADHVPHLTAFLSEVFGGPTTYTDRLGGFAALLEHHRDLRIDEAQRRRFVELFLAAADDVGWPADARTRTALLEYLEFGTEVAAQNSHATADAELHECQVVPRWDW